MVHRELKVLVKALDNKTLVFPCCLLKTVQRERDLGFRMMDPRDLVSISILETSKLAQVL